MTLRTGLAGELDGEPGDGVWAGLKLELGEGLDGWLDARPEAAATVGELESLAVVSAAFNPAADVDVFLAGCAESVAPGAGHICFGQVTMGLRVSLLLVLAVSRIRATASAINTTVGKITAQK